MSSSTMLTSVRQLRSLLAVRQGPEQKDEQLLQDFRERGDEIAFATLVRRHGPMVLGVCRRVLGHEQDAEDAFQATFLVLAQRAASVHQPGALGGFLHGTASHLAAKAKRAAGRRRKHEGARGALTRPRSPANPTDEMSWREVRALLDEEIARLPENYRSVFVLCYLEELSQAEVGRRLGLSEGAVANRLARARKRLAQRLARRGVELTAVLTATAVATPPASALPFGLLAKTITAVMAAASGKELASVVSASVVELVQGATTMIGSKAKIAALLVFLVATSGSLVGWFGRASGPLAATTKYADDKPKAAPSKREAAKGEVIRGRILDPDGKPIKAARLHWPRFHKDRPNPEDKWEWVERGRSDDEGKFRFALPVGDDLHDSMRKLVVTAAGYGLNWVELPKAKSSAEVTVQLRKDVTIRGRVLSMEGKPLAGVRVRVDVMEEMTNGRFEDYLVFWEQDRSKTYGKMRWLDIFSKQALVSPAITDRDGCFQLSGVGSERIVNLAIRGKGIAHEILPVVARAGFDASALNKTARTRAAMMPGGSEQPPVLYGPSFDYAAMPERIVEGVVREAGSGKPVPGVRIGGSGGYRSNSGAITDKQGRYRLEGLPKMKRYPYLSAFPQPDSPWLPMAIHNKEANEGLQPVKVDFSLGRGVVLKGRVIDRSTGKGVSSSIMFDYLPDNKYAGKPGYEPWHHSQTSEADGRFRIKVIPGTGVLKAIANRGGREANPFLPAKFNAEDRKHVTFTAFGDFKDFATFGGGNGFLSMLNAVKWLDLAPDAGAVEQDLYLERGATATVRIHDPQGKPLSGVIVSGIDAIPGLHSQEAYVAPEVECTLVALQPRQPRHVIFYHAERRLSGSLTVRGDEKETLTVRLAPTGTVIGRLLDGEGQPMQGAEIETGARGPSTSTSLSYLYLSLNKNRLPVSSDKEGRFRLEGVVPDEKFAVSIRRRGAYLNIGSRTEQLQIKSGETLDLGDLRIKRGL